MHIIDVVQVGIIRLQFLGYKVEETSHLGCEHKKSEYHCLRAVATVIGLKMIPKVKLNI
jgi:hypothetical protein